MGARLFPVNTFVVRIQMLERQKVSALWLMKQCQEGGTFIARSG